MIAFIDESRRMNNMDTTYSIGFFITDSFEPAYDILIRGYSTITKKYGLRLGKKRNQIFNHTK